MKKIFIIEDNDKDFESLYNLIAEEFKDYLVYPKSIEENRELRKNIKALFSASEKKSEPARKFLNELNINNFDGLILDYELYPSIRLVTGIVLYNELNLNLKTLILTKYTAKKFDIIFDDLKNNESADKILVKQKGNLVVMPEVQKNEHIKNIREHLFGEIVNSDSHLTKSALKKLAENKPKLNGASDQTNRDIYRITGELIEKIENKKLIITQDIVNKIFFESDSKYLMILNQLNN